MRAHKKQKITCLQLSITCQASINQLFTYTDQWLIAVQVTLIVQVNMD